MDHCFKDIPAFAEKLCRSDCECRRGPWLQVTHRETGEVMVLKELHRLDEEAQRNFLKEVAVLRSLHHDNVLRFIGVLYRDKRLHLVTEYVSGGSLRALLHDSSEPLPWEQRVGLARDIAAGMVSPHLSSLSLTRNLSRGWDPQQNCRPTS